MIKGVITLPVILMALSHQDWRECIHQLKEGRQRNVGEEGAALADWQNGNREKQGPLLGELDKGPGGSRSLCLSRDLMGHRRWAAL